ncbi:2-oxoglutarate dehydrogenase complex E2 component [Apiotrichum porosum]|uniref:dihydrolipoyllysine-residue succinyltransferase n=1 Tax=Apiotrichum porosum TaxID=105984 RepID=A0A427XG06_9TREE|nr:2-oxoglutarate dehydrogenase complex E2 component [Apiotrichum porosum]RSH77746.1 2-oxoglutarate dehydrogenase complex E2 component [Apiotrichum porosum]
MLRTPARALAAVAKASGSAAARRAPRTVLSARPALPVSRVAAVPLVRSFHATSFTAAPVTVKVPQMAESITEGTLKQYTKAVGDFVKADEEIATIETDKIDVSVNAPQSGKIVELLAEEDSTVTVGQDLIKIEPGEAPEGEAAAAPAAAESAAPAAEAPKAEAPKAAAPAAAAPAPKAAAPHPPRRRPLPLLRRALAPAARRPNAAAALTTFNEIDMSSIMEFRKLYKDGVLKAEGVKLGFMSAFSRASVLALREIPEANASIEDDQIVYRDYVDLSVAVSTPKGLVTPVLRNAESMGLVDIEREIAALGARARDGKLSIEDMSGGTFTISNGGVFGSLYGTPIINLPQAAVLGMHSIKEKPVVVNGQIVIRPIMVVALTYDHRLLDGREAVTFLVRIKEYLEDPRRMLLPSPV